MALVLFYKCIDKVVTESLDAEPLVQPYSAKVESVSNEPLVLRKPDQVQQPSLKIRPEITIQKPKIEDCDWYNITTTTELDDFQKPNMTIASNYKRISETSKSSLTSLEQLVINHEADIQNEQYLNSSKNDHSDKNRYMTMANRWFYS